MPKNNPRKLEAKVWLGDIGKVCDCPFCGFKNISTMSQQPLCPECRVEFYETKDGKIIFDKDRHTPRLEIVKRKLIADDERK